MSPELQKIAKENGFETKNDLVAAIAAKLKKDNVKLAEFTEEQKIKIIVTYAARILSEKK